MKFGKTSLQKIGLKTNGKKIGKIKYYNIIKIIILIIFVLKKCLKNV